MLKNGLGSTKEEKEKLISRNDIILIIIVLIIGVAAFFFIKAGQKKGGEILITLDGEEYGRYPLDTEKEITIDDGDYSNTIVIEDGKASMRNADCPDQICVNHTPIYKNGETIICLPHRLVILVEDQNENNTIDVILK